MNVSVSLLVHRMRLSHHANTKAKIISCIHRLPVAEISTTSAFPAPHFTITSRVPADKEKLIPEHLHYSENESAFRKFVKLMNGDSAPMVPVIVMLVGIHAYILWYLFGGEFEEDFAGEEKVPFFTDFVNGGNAVGRKIKNTLSKIFIFSSTHDNQPEPSIGKRDSVS